jgi:transcriptional regulator with XRE-family HTH domain
VALKERMLNYRAKNRISQYKLASLLGTSQTNIWRIENEKVKVRKNNLLYFEQKMDELEGDENVNV